MGYEHRSDSQQMDDRNDPKAKRPAEQETSVTRDHDKDMLLAGLKHDLKVAKAEIERLRACVAAIQKATVDGRVCDDVAWFDGITTLYDFCDAALAGNEHLLANTVQQAK